MLTAYSYDIEPTSDGYAPSRIHLLPAGDRIEGRDGRVFNAGDIGKIIEAFKNNKADLPVDIEHATEIKAKNGDPAPAVGWIKSLVADVDGIWGDVEWTEEGQRLVAEKKYRYISPVFEMDTKSKRVLKFLSAALTNQPNLILKSLNQENKPEGEPMGLTGQEGADAFLKGEPEARAIVESIKSDDAPRTAPEIEAEVTLDVKNFATRDEVRIWQERAQKAEKLLKALEIDGLFAEIDREVNKAIVEGKIPPSAKKSYQAMCATREGFESFKALMAESQPIVSTELNRKVESYRRKFDPELDAAQREIARTMGISEDAFKNAKIQIKSKEGV